MGRWYFPIHLLLPVTAVICIRADKYTDDHSGVKEGGQEGIFPHCVH